MQQNHNQKNKTNNQPTKTSPNQNTTRLF